MNKVRAFIRKTIQELILEKRIHYMITFHQEKEQPIWERFATLNKPIRVVIYCRRFQEQKQRKNLKMN